MPPGVSNDMLTIWLFVGAGQPFWLGMHDTAQTPLAADLHAVVALLTVIARVTFASDGNERGQAAPVNERARPFPVSKRDD